ncbi:MAG: YraN family protein [Planctomycetota bacterium]|jgi:putative endonuclease
MKKRGKREALELGEAGERFATRFLRRAGYRVLDTRVKGRGGEIDIVALEGDTVCFVEVKTRRSEAVGTPEEAVDAGKIRRIVRAAREYIGRHRLHARPVRYDVVALRVNEEGEFEGHLIRGAFYEDGWS